jgi:hypothetical protein
MTVWLVTYDDGDYYCEGGHLIGIFSSKELAEDAKDQFDKNHYERHYYGSHYTYEIEEIEVDQFQPWGEC